METSGTGKISRMYYRNNFFHIGHLKTLYDNERVARKNNGVCYAIIDDRQDATRISSIQEDFDFLCLTHIKTISVKREHQRIINYTLDLVQAGHVYIYHCDEKITNIERIHKSLASPKMHFQLRLNCNMGDADPAIGYTSDDNGSLAVALLFDYIIKVLDVLLKVTDIITTSQTDIADVKDMHISVFFDKLTNINHCRLDTYHIHNFRYSKRGWDVDEKNPYLLTIKGLKARHVPVAVLKAFYLHACQMGSIKIQFLATLLNKYLFKHSERTLGVIKPVKVHLENWQPKQTEYVCGPKNSYYSKDIKHYPLSDVIYIDSLDYGIEPGKLNKGRTLPLCYGPVLTCSGISLANYQKPVLSGIIELTGSPYSVSSPNAGSNSSPNAGSNSSPNATPNALGNSDVKKIHWISAPWDEQPCQAQFVLYNWFYTGFNSLLLPEVVDGFIDNSVFNNLDKTYHIEHLGYFVYDRERSMESNLPTFIRICKI